MDMIDVWKVEEPETKQAYFETDPREITDMLKEMDDDSQYLITKTKLTASEYGSLPEFQGF